MTIDITQNNEEALYLWQRANEQDVAEDRTAEEQAAGIATACTYAEEEDR